MTNPIDRMSPLTQLLHLGVVVGFAVAQPLYDLLAGQAEFFVARQSPALDIYLTAAIVSLIFPVFLFLLARLAGLCSGLLGRATYLLIMVWLVFAFCLIAIRQNDLAAGYWAFMLSMMIALIALAIYRQYSSARTFVTIMSPAILIFPIVFLLSDNVAMLRQANGDISADKESAQVSVGKAYPPIVMVLFDELALNALLGSDGEIDAVRYPNFAALAGTSTWYRNATTVVPVTNFAVPAILSGRYPNVEALPVAFQYPQTLFSLLQDTHVLNIHESVTRLCPSQSCRAGGLSFADTSQQLMFDLSAVYGHMALPLRFSHWIPPLGHKWGGFVKAGNIQSKKDEYKALESEVRKALRENLNSNRVNDLNRFVHSIDDWSVGDKPPLHFLHLLVPHRPWKYYPSGTMYTSRDARVPGMDAADIYWGPEQSLADQAHGRYLMQVALADVWLGRIVEKLKRSALYAESLLVVVSDHGASFAANDAARKLSTKNYEAILPVPLFVKAPGQVQGRVDAANVEVTDVLPTMAQIIGLDLPVAVDGKPADSPEVLQRTTKRVYDFFSHWKNEPLDVDAALPGRSKRIEQKISLFGEGLQGGLHAMGEWRALQGKSPQAFTLVSGKAGVSINEASLFQDITLGGQFLPGLITGSLLGAESPPASTLVFALNGVLCAVAPVYQDAGGAWVFSALLPEAGFVEGHNVVDAYFAFRAEGGVDNAAVTLQAAGSSGASRFELAGSDANLQVVYERDTAPLPVVPLAVHGYVDTAITRQDSLVVSGWAIDPNARTVVDRLLVFANGKGVAQSVHNGLERPDILKYHGVPKGGFSVQLPRGLLQENKKLEIRVVGVNSDGSAGELGYIEAFDWRPDR